MGCRAQDESEVFADNLPRMQQADISYSPSRQAQALALKVPDLQDIQAMQVSSTPSPSTPPISNSSVLSNYKETDMNAHFLKAQVQNLQVELSSQNQQMNRLRVCVYPCMLETPFSWACPASSFIQKKIDLVEM